MSKNRPFRAWFYFRQGWTAYFAFIMAAINVLTVTYFLAIENYPSLQAIFPTFAHYIIIVVGIGVPLLVLVGYFHYKRSQAFAAEADINIEANPYWYKIPQFYLSAFFESFQDSDGQFSCQALFNYLECQFYML